MSGTYEVHQTFPCDFIDFHTEREEGDGGGGGGGGGAHLSQRG